MEHGDERVEVEVGAQHPVALTPLERRRQLRISSELAGEVAPVLPFMAALTISVSDVDAARAVVDGNDVATRDAPGGFLVGAAAAGGAAIVFVAA